MNSKLKLQEYKINNFTIKIKQLIKNVVSFCGSDTNFKSYILPLENLIYLTSDLIIVREDTIAKSIVNRINEELLFIKNINSNISLKIKNKILEIINLADQLVLLVNSLL